MATDLKALVDIYDQWTQYKRKLEESIAVELTNATEQVKKLEQAIIESFPDGVTSMDFVGPTSGDKLAFGISVTTSYSPEAGKADDFYAWVAEHGRFDLLTRAIKKSGIEAEIATTGKFPPFIQTFTDRKLSVRRTTPPPTVSFKPTGV